MVTYFEEFFLHLVEVVSLLCSNRQSSVAAIVATEWEELARHLASSSGVGLVAHSLLADLVGTNYSVVVAARIAVG